MCRLYKFKIWDKKHDRWFHGDTNPEHARFGTDAIDLFGEVIVFSEILHDQHEDDIWENDPDITCSLDKLDWLEVYQSTGLVDKKNRIIYDGNIVSAHDGDKTGVVTRERTGAWTVHWDNAEPGKTVLASIAEATEVIGHICENPELPKKKEGGV